MNVKGTVGILCSKDSFLAQSLKSKLEENRLGVFLSHGDIEEMGRVRDNLDLIVLFMDNEMKDLAEAIIYLKDLANDQDKRFILVGDQEQYDIISKTIPDTLIEKWFQRPLALDRLIDCITKYLDANTGENKKKTILIVDDDITYMRMVYEWLKEKYHVGMATSGVQAISYLARNRADLVLLDYEMPIADGPQVLSMLKNDSQTGSIPVMFLTGHSDRESVLSVMDLKPVDYLLKTIEKEGLLEKIDAYFKSTVK